MLRQWSVGVCKEWLLMLATLNVDSSKATPRIAQRTSDVVKYATDDRHRVALSALMVEHWKIFMQSGFSADFKNCVLSLVHQFKVMLKPTLAVANALRNTAKREHGVIHL